MLINDRQIMISAAGSRKAVFWPQQKLYWSELVEKLKAPARGTETLAEYLSYSKSKQDELRDVGGFVAGTLKDNRRKANNVLTREVITLDLINRIYKVVRKTSARKRQIRTAARSSLLTVFMLSFISLAVVFNSGTVNAKSYVFEGGQLYDDSSVYVDYTLVGDFKNIKDIAGMNEINRKIKVIGADTIATEFMGLSKISENAVIFSERIKLNNVSKDGKAMIIKQNISKIEEIEGEWTVTLKIMRQKVKEEKIKEGKIKG